jgi:hypothetical protein
MRSYPYLYKYVDSKTKVLLPEWHFSVRHKIYLWCALLFSTLSFIQYPIHSLLKTHTSGRTYFTLQLTLHFFALLYTDHFTHRIDKYGIVSKAENTLFIICLLAPGGIGVPLLLPLGLRLA